MSTAHELATSAINGIFGDPELSRKAADAIIEALGLCTKYHVKVPGVAYRGGMKYDSPRWYEYFNPNDIARDWGDAPDIEVLWSLTSIRHYVEPGLSP